MGDHARLSPSGGSRWYHCPASVAREAGIPDKDNPDSLRGTAAHALLEAAVKGAAALDVAEMIGMHCDAGTGVTLDAEDIAAVRVAFDHVSVGGWSVQPEMKVVPGEMIGREDCFGTLDILRTKGDVLEIADYKHGFGIVEPEENIQLILYALGAYAYLARKGIKAPGTFHLTIIQPRAPHNKGPVRSWPVSQETLLGWAQKLSAAAKETDDPRAKAVPGDAQCKWCKVGGTCPERAQASLQIVQAKFTPVDTTHASLQANLSREPAELTMDQLVFVRQNAALIRGFLDAVETYLEEQAKAGVKVPLHKIVRGPGARKYAKPDSEVIGTIKAIKKLDGTDVTAEDYMKESLKTPKQLEDTLRTRVSKEDMEVIQGLISKTAGRLMLAPESDPREEVCIAIEDLFKPIETKPAVDVPGVDMSFLN